MFREILGNNYDGEKEISLKTLLAIRDIYTHLKKHSGEITVDQIYNYNWSKTTINTFQFLSSMTGHSMQIGMITKTLDETHFPFGDQIKKNIKNFNGTLPVLFIDEKLTEKQKEDVPKDKLAKYLNEHLEIKLKLFVQGKRFTGYWKFDINAIMMGYLIGPYCWAKPELELTIDQINAMKLGSIINHGGEFHPIEEKDLPDYYSQSELYCT